MKLRWKGCFEREEQLARAELPDNAALLQEPETLEEMAKQSQKMLWWAVIPASSAFVVRWYLWGLPGLWDWFHPLGILWFLLLIVPHELLHAAVYPRKAICELWTSPKNQCLFVICTVPVTKRRFVGISLMPAIVLGILPLLGWCLFPSLKGSVFIAAILQLGACCGDLFNTQNVLRQIPKGAVVQQSGLHTYWYQKEN